MRVLVAAVMLALAGAAHAQEVGTPSQIALQINGAVANIAQRAEYAEHQVIQLNARVKELEKQLADAKAKEKPDAPAVRSDSKLDQETKPK